MARNTISPADTRSPAESARIRDLEEALLTINRIQATALVKNACMKESPVRCVETLIIPALEEIGRKWEQGDAALSQVYMSGRMCEEIVDRMIPSGHSGRKDQPKMAVAVLEDYHTLGKKVLYSVLRAGGYDVIDYGAGVSADDLVNHVVRDKVDILLISTLMLPAALRTKEAIQRIRIRMPGIRIIVGGAPFRFDAGLWKEVGADAMGRTATDAVEIVREMAGGG